MAIKHLFKTAPKGARTTGAPQIEQSMMVPEGLDTDIEIWARWFGTDDPQKIEECQRLEIIRSVVIDYQDYKRRNWDSAVDPDEWSKETKGSREAAIPVNIIPNITPEQVAGIIKEGKRVTGLEQLAFGMDEIREYLD